MSVILTAFANSEDNHLPFLRREEELIYEDLVVMDTIKCVRLGDASVAQLIKHIKNFHQELIIFHFGGHSNSDSLLLTDQSAEGEGLAELLAQAPNLQLVFLNGCANQKQVKILRDAGVKALIIATTNLIGDDKAQIFATSFYHSLAKGIGYLQAFDFAKAELLTLGKTERDDIKTARFMGVIDTIDRFPWYLFYSDENEHLLSSTLHHQEAPLQLINNHPNRKINEFLINELFEAFAVYDADLQFKYQAYQQTGKYDTRKIRVDLINCLPEIMGEQLRKVIKSQPPDHKRLGYMMEAYQVSIHFLCLALVSQIWENLFLSQSQGTHLGIGRHQKTRIIHFLNQSKESYKNYSYLPLIKDLLDVLKHHQNNNLSEEIGQLVSNLELDDGLKAAIVFFDKLCMNHKKGKVPNDGIEAYCVSAEEYLAIFFKNLAFVIQYKLKTIKQIEVHKSRFDKASFRHIHYVLDNIDAGYLQDEIDYAEFTDSKSVIFFKIPGQIAPRLNLTPLVIDKNALDEKQDAELPNLYYYAYYDANLNAYYFEKINNSKLTFVHEKPSAKQHKPSSFLKIDANSLPQLNSLLNQLMVDFS